MDDTTELERRLREDTERGKEMGTLYDLLASQRERIRVLEGALRFLYEQVSSLEDYRLTRDLDAHEAEACFAGAIAEARAALAGKPTDSRRAKP